MELKTNKTSILKYLLTDFLEMHFSPKQKILEAVQEKLLDQKIRQEELHSLPAFSLEDTLVVVRNGNSKEMKELFLLNPADETFRIFRLK